MTCKWIAFCLMMSVLYSSCYSLKGITIDPVIETFFVDQFQNSAGNAPPDIGQRFSEDLKDVVLNNSRLNYNEDVPDIEFSGSISSYNIQSVAPEVLSGESTATTFGSSLNRLNISVNVVYTNNRDDEDTWTQVFSFFQNYGVDEDLSQVQDDLIDQIFDQITNDIFNQAFTNW